MLAGGTTLLDLAKCGVTEPDLVIDISHLSGLDGIVCGESEVTIGALIGKFNKSGIDSEFRDRVAHLIEPGHSAVVIMAAKVTEDRFTAAMQPFGGTVLKTSMSEADERELAEELAGQ